MVLKRIIAGQIRHLFGTTSGGLYGWMLANGGSPADIEAIIAGTVAVAMFAWSFYEKKKEEKKNEKTITTNSPN